MPRSQPYPLMPMSCIHALSCVLCSHVKLLCILSVPSSCRFRRSRRRSLKQFLLSRSSAMTWLWCSRISWMFLLKMSSPTENPRHVDTSVTSFFAAIRWRIKVTLSETRRAVYLNCCSASGVQRSGGARSDCLDYIPPYQIQILSSGVWWSLLPDICCLWGYNMTSHSRLQTNGLAKFVDITYILFYTHSPYSLYNESLQWT